MGLLALIAPLVPRFLDYFYPQTSLLSLLPPLSFSFFLENLPSYPKASVIMSASALLKSRVRRPSYLSKLAKAEDLIDLFPHGTYIGWSGFTGVGYPKYVLLYHLLIIDTEMLTMV